MDETGWPEDATLYDFDNVPGNRDLFLIGSDELELFRHHWKRYLAEPDGTTPEHPNEFLKFRWCAIAARRRDSCDINICITMMTRYHPAVRKLPRSKFVACVHFWNYQKRPYLIVAQDWFDEIQRSLFSLYAMVDAIGMRALPEKQGHVESQQVAALQQGVDQLAERYRDHAFFSFADNVLVKSNWSSVPDRYDATYRPELFLEVVQEVRQVIRSALNLNSYAVVSQGANLLADNTLVRVSPGQNHIFLGSLGTPFAQLVEIDQAIQKALCKGVHPPKELYLAHWFFITLHYQHYETKGELSKRLVPFESKVSTPGERSYLPIDAADLFPLLKNEITSSPARE